MSSLLCTQKIFVLFEIFVFKKIFVAYWLNTRLLFLNTNNSNNTNVPRLNGKGLEDTGFIRGSNL